MADRRDDKTHLPLTAQDEALLEAVREQQGLESIDQTVEWLARRHLRKGVESLLGRGRALYPVKGGRR